MLLRLNLGIWLAFAAAAQDAGNVAGTVVNAVTGEPVKKALVRLRCQKMDPRYVESNADGSFDFSRVPPGTCTVAAARSGYTDSPPPGSAKIFRASREIVIQPGRTAAQVKLELAAHAVVTGRVLDEDGDPKAGIHVTARREVWNSGQPTMSGSSSTTTNDLGEYRLTGIEAGRYLISAEDPRADVRIEHPGDKANGRTRGYVVTYHPETTNPQRAAHLELQPGQELHGIDIRMTRVPMMRVSGRTRVQGVAKPADVRVSPTGTGGNEIANSRTVSAEGSGAFEYKAIPPGNYRIIAIAKEAGKTYTAVQPVTVGESDVDVTLDLVPGTTLRGKVSVDGGEPGTGTISLAPTRGTLLFSRNEAELGVDGAFQIPDVGPGRFRIGVSRGKGCGVKEAKLNGVEVADATIDLSQDVGEKTLTVKQWTGCGVVQGRAVDSEGKPVPFALVVLRRGAEDVRAISTGEDGEFKFTDVWPGTYQAFAATGVDYGRSSDPELAKQNEKNAMEVIVAERMTAAVVLTAKQP